MGLISLGTGGKVGDWGCGRLRLSKCNVLRKMVSETRRERLFDPTSSCVLYVLGRVLQEDYALTSGCEGFREKTLLTQNIRAPSIRLRKPPGLTTCRPLHSPHDRSLRAGGTCSLGSARFPLSLSFIGPRLKSRVLHIMMRARRFTATQKAIRRTAVRQSVWLPHNHYRYQRWRLSTGGLRFDQRCLGVETKNLGGHRRFTIRRRVSGWRREICFSK